mmetsp:Transcript_7860/g.17280  ORF Transcript_7860/g.17280 Transcript_7860/m.17280 type:complete len:235 (+) Transcript_7860:1285-1989(+)
MSILVAVSSPLKPVSAKCTDRKEGWSLMALQIGNRALWPSCTPHRSKCRSLPQGPSMSSLTTSAVAGPARMQPRRLRCSSADVAGWVCSICRKGTKPLSVSAEFSSKSSSSMCSMPLAVAPIVAMSISVSSLLLALSLCECPVTKGRRIGTTLECWHSRKYRFAGAPTPPLEGLPRISSTPTWRFTWIRGSITSSALCVTAACGFGRSSKTGNTGGLYLTCWRLNTLAARGSSF